MKKTFLFFLLLVIVISCLWGQTTDVLFKRVTPVTAALGVGESYMIVAEFTYTELGLCEEDHGKVCSHECDDQCDGLLDPDDCTHHCTDDDGACQVDKKCDCDLEEVKSRFYALSSENSSAGIDTIAATNIRAAVEVTINDDVITNPDIKTIFKVVDRTISPATIAFATENGTATPQHYLSAAATVNLSTSQVLTGPSTTAMFPTLVGQNLELRLSSATNARAIRLATHNAANEVLTTKGFINEIADASGRVNIALFKLYPPATCLHNYGVWEMTPPRFILEDATTVVQVQIDLDDDNADENDFTVELVYIVNDETEKTINMTFIEDNTWEADSPMDVTATGIATVKYFIRITHDECGNVFNSTESGWELFEQYLFGTYTIADVKAIDQDVFVYEGFTVELTGIATIQLDNDFFILQQDNSPIGVQVNPQFPITIGTKYTVIGELVKEEGILVIEVYDSFITTGTADNELPAPKSLAGLAAVNDPLTAAEFHFRRVSVTFEFLDMEDVRSIAILFTEVGGQEMTFVFDASVDIPSDLEIGDRITITGVLMVDGSDVIIFVHEDIKVNETPDPTPFVLNSFLAASTQNGTVNIEWITASETNVTGFHLFRSYDEEFTNSERITLDMKPAHNTTVFQTYRVHDANVVVNNTYWYMIEIHHNDQTITTSHKISVLVEQEIEIRPTLFTSLRFVENPVRNAANFEVFVKSGETATLRVFNVRGQMVKEFALPEGSRTYNWDLRDTQGRDVASGVYFFRLESPTTQEVKRTMVVR